MIKLDYLDYCDKAYAKGFVDGKLSAIEFVLSDIKNRIQLEISQNISYKLILKNQKLLTDIYNILLKSFGQKLSYQKVKRPENIEDEEFSYKEGFLDGNEALLFEVMAELQAEYCRRKQLNRILLKYIVEDYNDRYILRK